MAWYHADAGGDEEPDRDVTALHRLITRLLVGLARHYSELFSTEVDFNLALEWLALKGQ